MGYEFACMGMQVREFCKLGMHIRWSTQKKRRAYCEVSMQSMMWTAEYITCVAPKNLSAPGQNG